MDDRVIEKIVDFEKYCKTCKHAHLEADENGNMPEPCNGCLTEPVNENSQKPVMYDPDEEVIKKEQEYLANNAVTVED